MDTDGDGAVSLEELVAGFEQQQSERMQQRAQRMLERMDADKDGKLSSEELEARQGPAEMFDRIDANSDGVITEEEIADLRSKMGKRFGKGKGMGEGRGERHGKF